MSSTPLSCVLPALACAWLASAAPAVAQEPAAAPPATTTAGATPTRTSTARLELRPGDRVILIGNTLAERQQYFNHFETLLLAGHPTLDLSVRNLGWSADTLTLQPRPLNFGDAAQHLGTYKADVMIAFFGLNESFAGEVGIPQFEKDLEAYVATHRKAHYNGTSSPRLALVSPIAHERLERLVHVDVEARNRELARYTEAMRQVAARLDVPFADVFTPTRQAMSEATSPLTINGIHLNEDGDRLFARILLDALGLSKPPAPPMRGKAFADLKGLVNEKNRLFFLRWRPLNAEYVVGRRVDPFGSVSFPPEMKQLDTMVAAQDKRIWRQARLVARAGATPSGPARSPVARPSGRPPAPGGSGAPNRPAEPSREGAR